MGSVVSLSSATKLGRGPNSPPESGSNDVQQANFSCRLFLLVSVPTFAMIEWLREALEAPSYGDVIRQAARAFAIHFVTTKRNGQFDCTDVDDGLERGEMLKRLNLRVPIQTRERLDLLKEMTGLSYTAIIITGLELLAVKAKREEGLLRALLEGHQPMKGDDHPVELTDSTVLEFI